jgi:hypothetical protein
MSDQEKLQAVQEYLRTEFPDAKIDIKHQPQERVHVFQILHQGKRYSAIMVEAFLQGCEAAQIPATLEDFTLAEHLREMGMTPVVVTPEGLKLQGD